MQTRDFCFWLQGFMELRPDPSEPISTQQVGQIAKHLALVFKHDVSMAPGSMEHTVESGPTEERRRFVDQVRDVIEKDRRPPLTALC